MKQRGIYYDDVHNLFLIGFKNSSGTYTAMVVGCFNDSILGLEFDYFDWDGLSYIGKGSTFNNLNMFLSWLDTADYTAIKGRYLLKEYLINTPKDFEFSQNFLSLFRVK